MSKMGRLTEAFDWLTRSPKDLLSPRDRNFYYAYLDDIQMKELREKYRLYKNNY
jgi:hypothetical protein